MMLNDLISVIIPAYNAEKTIEKCLESILNQRFQNFEIIIVDDGSDDKTFDICNGLAKQNSCISVVHQENGGLSAARNTGIERAKGTYIVFIDSDDCVSKYYLEQLVLPMIHNSVDIVICGITINYLKEGYSVDNGFEKFEVATDTECASKLIYKSFENGMIYSSCNKLYKREIIIDNHIIFPINKEPIEDIVFNCEYMKYINSIAVIPECPYFYNKNDIESNVTKYRENIWELSAQRSEEIQLLFTHWNMNSDECMSWIASEYIGGKADCISNCYRYGSNLKFKEKCKLFKHYIIKDQNSYDAIKKIAPGSLYFDKKILTLMIKIKNPFIFTCVYEVLFFLRYKMKKFYYLFRKKQVSK